MRRTASLALLSLVAACSGAIASGDAGGSMDAAGLDASSDASACVPEEDASTQLPDGATIDLRGVRYCEVLLARFVDGGVSADVFNTLGVSTCPQSAWSALDATGIARTEGVSIAVLNGPRYWLIDRFQHAELLDPTVRNFGCIPMRLAGRVQVGGAVQPPYTPRAIQRNTTVVFTAGHTVYELVDPMGRVFDMQSYSVQRVAQDEASLSTLGSRLTLPQGWRYRTRTLTTDLVITAVDGVATLVQDDVQNSYQLSQQ